MSHTPGPWEFGRSDLEDAAAYLAIANSLKDETNATQNSN